MALKAMRKTPWSSAESGTQLTGQIAPIGQSDQIDVILWSILVGFYVFSKFCVIN
jgi:hypothetical protein